MEPNDLLKLLGDLASMLAAGGKDVYNAAYQSVLVCTWRDIYIFSGLVLVGVLILVVGAILIAHRRNTTVGKVNTDAEYTMIVLGIGVAVLFAVALVVRIFDLQRLDYLAIKAIRLLAE